MISLAQNTSNVRDNQKLRIRVGKKFGIKKSIINETEVNETITEVETHQPSTSCSSMFDSTIDMLNDHFEKKYMYYLDNFQERTERVHREKEPTLKEDFLSMAPGILLGIGLSLAIGLVYTGFFTVAFQLICDNMIATFSLFLFFFTFTKSYQKIRTSFYKSLHRITGRSFVRLQICFLIIRVTLLLNPLVLDLFKAICSY